MTLCGYCNLAVIRDDKIKISCITCMTFFHGKCVGARTESEAASLAASSWECKNCSSKYDTVLVGARGTVPTDESTMVTCDILNKYFEKYMGALKQDLVGEMETKHTMLTSTINELSRMLEETNAKLRKQEEISNSQRLVIERLQGDNTTLQRRVDFLEEGLDAAEQYSRRNILEIQGIPFNADEDVTKVAVDVCQRLGVNLTKLDIDCCHRLPGRNSDLTGIIVKFLRRSDADEVLYKKKRFEGLFTTRTVGLNFTGEPNTIYINNSLTPFRRGLLKEARSIKKKNNLRYVWADRMGRVKIRPVEKGKIYVIKNYEDLKKFDEQKKYN